MVVVKLGRVPAGKERVAAEIGKFLECIGEHLDDEDVWTVNVVTQARSRTRFKVKHFDRERIQVRVMPGDNGTCWECEIRPKGTAAFILGRELSLFNGFDGVNVPDAVLANRDGLEDEEVSSNGNAKNFPSKPVNGHAVPTVKPQTKPATKPQAKPEEQTTASTVAAILDSSSPSDVEDSIFGKLQKAEQQAKAHRQREREIEQAEKRVSDLVEQADSLLKQSETAQKHVDSLRKAQDADIEGRTALQAIAAFQRLFSEAL